MSMRIAVVSFAVAALLAPAAASWEGSDSATGEAVTIESGNLVRTGLDIEVYDSSDGAYHNVTVESMQSNGSGVDVEVYDQETGETRTLEMDE